MVFNATFINISVVSWPSGLLVEESGENIYHMMLCTSPWSRFELTITVVIGTYYLGSCKSNYHIRYIFFFSIAENVQIWLVCYYNNYNLPNNLLVCLFDGVERHFQQYFSCIVAVSFIGGGNRRKPVSHDAMHFAVIEIWTHNKGADRHWLIR
jgi:hypothetical protein